MPRLRWGPLAGEEKAPSLLDKKGHLFAPSPEGIVVLDYRQIQRAWTRKSTSR